MRCVYCNELLQSFDEETLSLCLIAVETFLHREPTMAAPMLFRIINTVTRCHRADVLDDWPQRLSRILFNLAAYLPYVPSDAYFSQWSSVISLLDSFFRRLLSQAISFSCFEIMSVVMRVQNFSTFKVI
ncbi:unnamed protein product [Anisakis simplex]|uniref:Uncharacterized protein n=1 Tax=Anisakis simplex TaxID=6269 RepID=A0A3P6SJ89_ANISI|nr:unnamed protein product [Anisakis simplex]